MIVNKFVYFLLAVFIVLSLSSCKTLNKQLIFASEERVPLPDQFIALQREGKKITGDDVMKRVAPNQFSNGEGVLVSFARIPNEDEYWIAQLNPVEAGYVYSLVKLEGNTFVWNTPRPNTSETLDKLHPEIDDLDDLQDYFKSWLRLKDDSRNTPPLFIFDATQPDPDGERLEAAKAEAAEYFGIEISSQPTAPAFVEGEELVGAYNCADRHPFWEEKNLHFSIFQLFLEGGKAIRVYSLTFYDEGAKVEFVAEHEWSVTGNILTLGNYTPHFSNAINKTDFRRGKFAPMSNVSRDQLIEVLNGMFEFPVEPSAREFRMSGQTLYYGDDDRFECLRSDGM